MRLLNILVGALAVTSCISSAFGLRRVHHKKHPEVPSIIHKIDEAKQVEQAVQHIIQQFQQHHNLNQQQLLDGIKSSFAIAPTMAEITGPTYKASYPVVFVHGMGDSCFNAGMASLPTLAASYLQTYAVCIPGGDDQGSDTMSAFFTTMNANVDNFAKRVANDTKLSNGFYAVGLSQGNLVLRGYMQKYNAPAIVRVLHVHGTMAGVAAFPHCPASSSICDTITSLLGSLAYNPLTQGILFQANYFRDPTRVNSTAYLQNSQIAAWNGEGRDASELSKDKDNFVKTQQLTMIKALADTMIDPNQSEWWGSYDVNSFSKVLSMTETDWYVRDTFGLQTLDKNQRLSFNTSTGDHLQFSSADLENWMIQAGFGQ